MVATAARIRFAADVESLKPLAQVPSQMRQIGAVAESRAETSIGSLQDVFNPGKAFVCEQRTINPCLSGAARVHPLYHGSVLGSHETRGLGTGYTQRMERLDRI